MKPKDKLFRLIKTLKRGEKRAFRLFAARYGGKSEHAYLQLFDLIESQKSFDEEELKADLQNQKWKEQLPVRKHQLFELVLNSLRSQVTPTMIDFRLSQGMEYCMLLHRRGLTGEGSRRLEKLISQAEAFEKYALMVRMLEVDKTVKRRLLKPKEFENYRKEGHKRQLWVLELLVNQLKFQELVDDFFYLYSSTGRPASEEAKAKYDKFLKHPLLQDPEAALSIKAQWNYYLVWFIYHYVQGEFAEARKCSLIQIEAFEQREGFTDAYLSEYLSVLNNHLTLLLELGENAEFEVRLNRVRDLGKGTRKISKFFRRRIFELTTSLEVEYAAQTGNIAPLIQKSDTIWEEMQRFRDAGGSNDRYIFILLNIGVLYFLSQDWQGAHKWIRRIEAYDNEGIALHLVGYARLLDLVLHFERGNWDLIPYRIESARRFLRKHNRLFGAERALLKMLEQVEPGRESRLAYLRQLDIDWQKIKDENSTQSLQNILRLDIWLEVAMKKG